jgi:hypothetical protein
MKTEKKYYISSGDLTAMYTLCFGYGHDSKGDYIVNLSIDAETAIKKAIDYVNAESDIYPLDTSYADISLNDIIRRDQEQIEAEKLRKKEENLAKWTERSLQLIKDGYSPFDKEYSDSYGMGGYESSTLLGHEKIVDIKQESINYWASLVEFKSVVHEEMHKACKPLAINIPANANKHFGTVGEKVIIKAMIIDQDWYENEYGYGNDYIRKIKYVTENGERLVTKGADTTKFNEAIFQATEDQIHMWVEIEATVKTHNEFTPHDSDKTWNTTSLIRPKLIKVFGQEQEVA